MAFLRSRYRTGFNVQEIITSSQRTSLMAFLRMFCSSVIQSSKSSRTETSSYGISSGVFVSRNSMLTEPKTFSKRTSPMAFLRAFLSRGIQRSQSPKPQRGLVLWLFLATFTKFKNSPIRTSLMASLWINTLGKQIAKIKNIQQTNSYRRLIFG